MKLLFDQNLSPRLVNLLNDLYPEIVHVSTIGLGNALDVEVWQHARDNDYMIVTKDVDFSEMAVVRGFPPKVIWIRRGNCSTQEIESILRENHPALIALADDKQLGILILF